MLLWSLGSGVGFALLGALAVVLVVRHYAEGLPNVEELEKNYAPPQITRILARDGTLLAGLFTERRTVVPFDRVPAHVKHAFLAAEDAGFYEHEGLNYLGMLRALVVNLRAGHVSQGGSTITQQVVKNVLLDSERSYRRKIRETILAHRLEQRLEKAQILGLYLNHIYLGHGRYGVEEAARYYFGKHVEELDLAEGALLAGIVASPERYSPRRSAEKALTRRLYVLGQMREKGFMTPAVYDAVVDTPLRIAPAVEAESDLAPEIVPHVRSLLREVAGEQFQRGGFTVHTTIDPHLQAAARKALRDNLDAYLKRQKVKAPFTLEKRRLWGEPFSGKPRKYGIYVGRVTAHDDEKGTLDVSVGELTGRVRLRAEERYNPERLPPSQFASLGALLRVRVLDDPEPQSAEPVPLRLEIGPQGALVAIDVGSREVLAVAGSYEAVMGGLDRTVQARRQPGSSFKPFVYSYALHARRVTPATHFAFPKPQSEQEKLERGADARTPSSTTPPEAAAAQPGPEMETLSLREGVARSDNRVAQTVLRDVGAQSVVDWAHALGIESKLGATDSLALGAYEVTPLEIANAYATFASGGELAAPRFVTKIVGPNGDVALPAAPPTRRVMDPEVAYLMTSLLESVVKDGTAKRATSLGRPLAGKTGTTNKAKDTWFVGYSTEYSVASWVGYDDALPLGWGEAGAVTALPAWIDFMKVAHQGKPSTQFPRPSKIVEQLIDPASGLLARFDQEDALTEVFLDGTVPTETAPEAAPAPTETPPSDEAGAAPVNEEMPPAPSEETPPTPGAESSNTPAALPEVLPGLPEGEEPPPF